MAVRGRKILKDFFSNGKRPSQQEFEDLIDSSVNILDDGYSKNGKDGLKLAPKNDSNVLLSFCPQSGAEPSWVFAINETEDLLIERKKADNHTTTERNTPSLLLTSPKTIVTGDIEIQGIKKGTPVSDKLKESLKADGKWHDITEDLNGMYAMEIVATICGEKGSGEYAVLLAWATQCYGNQKKVKPIGSHYGFWGHKLKLRWHRQKNQSYRLQIKSRLQYKNWKNLAIDCHISYLHKYERSISEKA